ncbi:MAG: hypothetical protein ACKVPJ_07870 [Chitinophagales bacterium]
MINQLFQYLKPDGEIHVIDTPFYSTSKAGKAKMRTQIYYESIGFLIMENNYHHRLCAELRGYQIQFFYKPSFLKRIDYAMRRKIYKPFPWIVIKK